MPAWIIQSIAGILLMGSLGWVTWATTHVNASEVRLAVTETKVDTVKSDIAEIKGAQKETNQKLDRLIEQRRPR